MTCTIIETVGFDLGSASAMCMSPILGPVDEGNRFLT